MKLLYNTIVLVLSVVVSKLCLAADTDDDTDQVQLSPFLRGTAAESPRSLLGNELEKIKAFYDPNGPTCWLKYQVKGNEQVKVTFSESQIKETAHNVTCSKSSKDPKNGLKLPLKEDIDDYTTWVGEDVFDADVRWGLKGNKRLELTIKRSSASGGTVQWKATYKSREPQDNDFCWLQYKVGDKDWETIRFKSDEIFNMGDEVACRRSKVEAKNGLKLPVEEDIDKYAEWSGEKVKDADVRWKENGDVELAIKKVPKTCAERVEYTIRKASLNPSALDKSGSSERKALDWLKGIVDCDEFVSTYDWILSYSIATIWYGMGGKNWKSDKRWLESSEVCEPDWEHLYCYDDDFEEINLDSNNVSGKLPKELGLLKFDLGTSGWCSLVLILLILYSSMGVHSPFYHRFSYH